MTSAEPGATESARAVTPPADKAAFEKAAVCADKKEGRKTRPRASDLGGAKIENLNARSMALAPPYDNFFLLNKEHPCTESAGIVDSYQTNKRLRLNFLEGVWDSLL